MGHARGSVTSYVITMPVRGANSSSRAADDTSVVGADVGTTTTDDSANDSADDAPDDRTPAQHARLHADDANGTGRTVSADVPMLTSGVATDWCASSAPGLTQCER